MEREFSVFADRGVKTTATRRGEPINDSIPILRVERLKSENGRHPPTLNLSPLLNGEELNIHGRRCLFMQSRERPKTPKTFLHPACQVI